MDQDKVGLPGVITAITPQKKRHDRSSVFVDDQFLIGVDNGIVLKYDLYKGVEMTSVLFRKIQQDEGRQVIKSYLLKLLARRDHARLELFQKAGRKDYSLDVVNYLLDELEAKGYINDRMFAQKFAHDKYHLSDWGPLKIKASLRRKGISEQTSEAVINHTFEHINLQDQFQKLIKKRKRYFSREENLLKRKKKMANYLQQKGYYTDDIYKHLDFFMKGMEE